MSRAERGPERDVHGRPAIAPGQHFLDDLSTLAGSRYGAALFDEVAKLFLLNPHENANFIRLDVLRRGARIGDHPLKDRTADLRPRQAFAAAD